MSKQNEELVKDFCAAFGRMDADEILGFMASDAVYHNIPMDPAKGHDEIRNVLQLFLPMATAVEFEMKAIGSSGDTVFTERVDIFTMQDGKRISLPVAGVFEVRDGKISAWRDYFDMAMWTSQM